MLQDISFKSKESTEYFTPETEGKLKISSYITIPFNQYSKNNIVVSYNLFKSEEELQQDSQSCKEEKPKVYEKRQSEEEEESLRLTEV